MYYPRVIITEGTVRLGSWSGIIKPAQHLPLGPAGGGSPS